MQLVIRDTAMHEEYNFGQAGVLLFNFLSGNCADWHIEDGKVAAHMVYTVCATQRSSA